MNRPTLIAVDDEDIVLQGLRSQLSREFGRDMSIEIATSGEEAISLVNELLLIPGDIPVVIADQLMPGMRGHELLREIHQRSPRTFNILLTGQVDVHAIGEAVNNANLYRYIAKPWDSTDLILTVREAIRSYFQDKKVEEQNELLRRYNEELEQKVLDRTSELEAEKAKTEELLLNILPHETATELKRFGYSTPRHYQMVSVLFADFKEFTLKAQRLKPDEIVTILNECFSAFDAIIEQHSMEKIKTIGDAYMCAGGIPTANSTNPLDAVAAACAMQDWLEGWNIRRERQQQSRWDLRIGVHTGELVAGVIGRKKFAYDIWGDAVNVASRLELNGEPGRINISGNTYEFIRSQFPCTYRGRLAVKNRGEIDMYFVD